MGKGPVAGIRREGRLEMPLGFVEVDEVGIEEEKQIDGQVSSSSCIQMPWASRS